MKTTLTKQTDTTPTISYNSVNNLLTIKGKSIPFEPEMYWSLVKFQIKNLKIDQIEVKLEYINTNSIPYLIEILNTTNGVVTWIYDESDDDMYELGKDLKMITKKTSSFIFSESEEYNFV